MWWCLVPAGISTVYGVSMVVFTDKTAFLRLQDHHFAVTNHRVIQTRLGEDDLLLHVIPYSSLRDVKLEEEADKTGTITCYPKHRLIVEPVRFRFIENAREAYHLIVSTHEAQTEKALQDRPA